MFKKREEKKRKSEFKRNQQLEKLLHSINNSLECAEQQLLNSSSELGPSHPIIFVFGPLRSGTTLFMQWIAATGLAAYPSNLLSRFYGAPLIGAQIQLLLTDPLYNFRNEITEFNNPITFKSENGKTKGALAPNEFWYFWRRFLPFQEIDWLPDDELFIRVDIDKLTNELTALTRIFNKPFALKSMILNYNIPFLNKIFKNAIFIQIKRNPVTNIASILDARKRQLGSETTWYSFKIREYYSLKNLDPISQAAGQLHYINTALEKGMATIEESKKIIVQYEDFCQNPTLIFNQLLKILNYPTNKYHYNGPNQFKLSRNNDVANRQAIEEALLIFPGE